MDKEKAGIEKTIANEIKELLFAKE